MTRTTVVHINHVNLADPDVVYIGRANWSRRIPRSDWYNPFRIGWEGTRDETIAKYRHRLLNSPHLLERLHELRGKRLACWCAPRACHGDVLAELADREPSP